MSHHASLSRFVLCPTLVLFAAIFLLAPAPAAAAEEGTPQFRPWYFFHGTSNSHPRLDDATDQIDRELNKVFRLIAPGFDDVNTFQDQAKDFMIWSPFIGVGHRFGDHWDAFFQVGGSAGKVRTESDDMSILLLPWHLDMEIKRSNIFVGPGLAWYPFGFVENRPKMTWNERFNGIKPYLMTTVMWNRMTYKAHVRAGLRPFGNFVQNKREDTWHPFSSSLGAGIDMPLTKNTTLSLNGQYNMMFDYGADFNGPTFSIFTKHAFGKPRQR